MRIGVISPLFPTPQEPYRGAAIWSTLEALTAYADISGYCVRPRYPLFLRPKAFRYRADLADTSAYGITSETFTYFAVPWVTRASNADSIYRRLRPQMNDARLDLLLCYWIHPDGHAAVRIAKELGIPVVIGARGTDLTKPDENRSVQRQMRVALEQADAVVCVSEDLARRARDMGAESDRVFTIHNGVDRKFFDWGSASDARTRLGVPAECRLAVFVGWLSELKGVSRLVEAIGMLDRREPGRWRVALIGEGYLRDTLLRQAKELGLGDRVMLLGPQRHADIAEWLRAADVLCMPSETEGCPNALLEALSVGLPVVATNVGGIPELVDEDCGVLLQDRRPADIAEGLERVAGQNWDRQAIAQKHGRGWNTVAMETFRVCQSVLARRKGTRDMPKLATAKATT
jgi:teichuronic acid biosynthesis glycosyltransferase TuaC